MFVFVFVFVFVVVVVVVVVAVLFAFFSFLFFSFPFKDLEDPVAQLDVGLDGRTPAPVEIASLSQPGSFYKFLQLVYPGFL